VRVETSLTSYSALAAYYDRLMAHIDYDAWADFALGVLALSAAEGRRPLVLDLACGTGSIAVRLAAKGVDVIGIDASSEMLAVAEGKAREQNAPVTLSEQDLVSFELPVAADAAVCLFDSLNYLTSVRELEAALSRAARALRGGAPFLFDLQTEERLRRIGEETYADAEEDVAYVWRSGYDERRRICEMHLTLFAKDPVSGLFKRYDEIHYERAHSPAEVERALRAAGFALESRWETDPYEPGRPGTGRMFYLARRVEANGGDDRAARDPGAPTRAYARGGGPRRRKVGAGRHDAPGVPEAP